MSEKNCFEEQGMSVNLDQKDSMTNSSSPSPKKSSTISPKKKGT